MYTTMGVKMICLALALLNPIRTVISKGESSGEYLQNVMFQLQEFNVPPPRNVYDRLSSINNYRRVINIKKDQHKHGAQRINMDGRRNMQRYRNQSSQHYNVLPSDKVDFNPNEFENFASYYQPQVPVVTNVQEPEAIGFTRGELATMYKNALETGSTISLSSLTNALSTGEVPKVTQTHVEFPIKQPLYQYYFFPLKTFMSEFKKDHGYKTIPVPAYDNTGAAQTTQTQLSNPLFVAISTFVTMAIVFMMSVLFLPKLIKLDILPARSVQDDFFYLSDNVANAIERYYFLDKKGRRVDSDGQSLEMNAVRKV